MWEFIQPYHAQAEYDVRFGVVMGMGNFVDEQHLEEFLRLFRRRTPRSLLRPHGRGMGGVSLLRQIPAAHARVAGHLFAGRLDLQQIAAENHRILPRKRRREAGNPGDETPPVETCAAIVQSVGNNRRSAEKGSRRHIFAK